MQIITFIKEHLRCVIEALMKQGGWAGRGRGEVRLLSAALLAGACWPALPCGPAFAQSVLPGAQTGEEIVIVGERRAAIQTAQARAQATPGGVSVSAVKDDSRQANVTLSDALSSAPGVVVQNFFGANDQPRVQIRGSGLQQNPVERGVLVMQDGLPLNRADGSYIVGLVDPRQAAFIEVFRGYTANRLGSTVLGGAMNFVLPSGAEADGVRLSAEAGAFGQVHASGAFGVSGAGWDAQAALAHTERDGFRVYNSSERTSGYVGATYRWNDSITTRLLAGHVDNRFDVSGPLSYGALQADPAQVSTGPIVVGGVAQRPGPNVVRDRPQRDTALSWIGARTTASLGRHALDGAVSYVRADDSFMFPVSSGERVTEGGGVNIMGRYAYKSEAGPLPLVEATALYSEDSADRDYYLNAAGVRGALFGTGELAATTYSLNVNANIPLGRGLTFSPSLSYAHAERRFKDEYALPTRPTLAFNPMNPSVRLPDGAVPTVDAGYDRNYNAVSPAVALSLTPGADDYLYVALSRTFEPPSHDDLLATINGTPNSSAGRPAPGNPSLAAAAFAAPALRAQTGDTLEVGWRGARGGVRFDALAYYAWIENELLNLRDSTGVSLGAVNAGDTRHFGLEFAASAAFTPELSARIAYVYQDFHFEGDPVRGDNPLAGAPPHVVNLDLDYKPLSSFALGLSVHWLPEATPVDNLNTLHNDAYAVFDARAVYRPGARWGLFVEGRNITDETYAASTLVVDQAAADQAVYIPGDGRAFYAGVSVEF
jgi:iron complex outermembrane receptor protein